MAAAKGKKGGKAAKKPAKKGKSAAARPAAKKPTRPAARKAARKTAPAKASRKAHAAAKETRPKAPAARAAAARPAPGPPPHRGAPPPSLKRPQPAAPPRPRRSRTRTPQSSGAPAAWFPSPEERPRPSSFIPAPPRVEAPSNVAAPPASSDRIVRPADLTGMDMAIRTFPVRVDLEQAGGRTRVHVFPEIVSIRAGDGLEWDFRYLGGADAIVEEIAVEFDKPAPFSKASFRSKNPGSARPHRQLSGPASPDLIGQTITYTIRCFNLIKQEVASARPTLMVQ